MPIPIPLLIAAGAVVVLGGKKPKSKTATRSTALKCGDSIPKGFICEDGVLRAEALDKSAIERAREGAGTDGIPPIKLLNAIDESMLDTESDDDTGDFEISEEDISIGADEEMGDLAINYNESMDQRETCREFLEAIYVEPSDADELALNDIAAEQTAIPAMKAVLLSQSVRPVEPDVVAPQMVLAALSDLVPVCKWSYDASGDFSYGDGYVIESEAGKEVLYALMKLSGIMIDEFNSVGGSAV